MEPRLFLNECLYEGSDYKETKDHIDKRNFLYINCGTEIRFNNPALATIFCSRKVEVKDLDTGQVQNIDLFAYQAAYIEGYESGLRYFDEEYHLSPTLLYGPAGPIIIEELYQVCFVRTVNNGLFFHGWASSSLSQPVMISMNCMKEHGKYAALLWRVEELQYKYPDMFKTWEQKGNTNKSSGNTKLEKVSRVTPEESTEFDLSVEIIAAMVYYLEKVGICGSQDNRTCSRAEFIRTEILPLCKNKYTLESITGKCSKYGKVKISISRKNCLLKTIELIKSIDKFNLDSAIGAIQLDIETINQGINKL